MGMKLRTLKAVVCTNVSGKRFNLLLKIIMKGRTVTTVCEEIVEF